MVRFKNRFLLLHVAPKDGRAHEGIGTGLRAAIASALELQHGAAFLEAVAPGLAVQFYHPHAGVAIVRVGREHHQKVLAACLKLGLVDFRAVRVRLLKLTGAFWVAKRAAGEHVQRLLPAKLSKEAAASLAALQQRLDSLYS